MQGCYNWGVGIDGDVQDCSLTAYDEALWKCHRPAIAAGRWFSDRDKQTEELEVVIAQKGGKDGRYQVGDTLSAEKELRDWVNEGDDTKISFKVIGIIENGASILGSKLEGKKVRRTTGHCSGIIMIIIMTAYIFSGYSPICCGVSISMPVHGRRRC
ncbi:hypothetical protein DXB96_08275 [Clostridium sp. OM07-10AC]|nr:hypothetical protein DXB96_08275 [Clostridium sp. OM07-10AC]